jgi:capsular polysaccharide biosynthesis protein
MPAADLYHALWRHRRLIVILTAIAAVAAFVYSSSQPKVYEASSLVRIQQRAATAGEAYGSVNSLELGERLAQTYARIVKTRSMATRVSTRLAGRISRSDISISAAPVSGVELLEISARNGDPNKAALVANATAVSLTEFVEETGTLRDRILVVDRATAPSSPVAPRPKLTVAIAVLLALLLNSALALLLEFFSDRLPSVDEFEERFGHPVLATVPGLSLRHPPGARSGPAAAPVPLPTPAAAANAERGRSGPRWDPNPGPALKATAIERGGKGAGGR